jgi:hypothetical protein
MNFAKQTNPVHSKSPDFDAQRFVAYEAGAFSFCPFEAESFQEKQKPSRREAET